MFYRPPTCRLLIVALLGFLLAGGPLGLNPASAHDGSEHDVEGSEGLGEYGPSGEIRRDLLSESVAESVSDEAIKVSNSAELAVARENWDDSLDFVSQVNYQLRFRSRADYLSSDAAHIGQVLAEQPDNVGIQGLRLYLTDDEAVELLRRLELGDKIPELVRALGEKADGDVPEGESPTYSANFAGVWQDQLDGGKLVVAVIDRSRLDESTLVKITDKSHLKIVEVEHSWNEVNRYRDDLVKGLQDAKIDADVIINSTGEGRIIEVVIPDPGTLPTEVVAKIPADLVVVTAGPVAETQSGPSSTHVEGSQQPGLQIEFDGGGNCTWGANGHTSSYNYVVTAGHCGVDPFEDFLGWVNSVPENMEVHQNNSFHLTAGNTFVYSRRAGGWDMKRFSSDYADSNGYHADGDWATFIRYRALHNSWEINSDLVCASMGTSNSYECGYILEENASLTCSGNSGSRWVRYDIDTDLGDSGAGIEGFLGQNYMTIDAIHACGGGSWGHGNTAYDVKQRLAFDYNCRSSLQTNRPTSYWGACPTTNR